MNDFETEECDRCGGIGRHGFSHRHGTRCFRCSGAGRILSKRGESARAFYESLLERDAERIHPGDIIRIGTGWARVFSRKVDADDCSVTFHTATGNLKVGIEARLRLRLGEMEESEAKALALSFQERLNDHGTMVK